MEWQVLFDLTARRFRWTMYYTWRPRLVMASLWLILAFTAHWIFRLFAILSFFLIALSRSHIPLHVNAVTVAVLFSRS